MEGIYFLAFIAIIAFASKNNILLYSAIALIVIRFLPYNQKALNLIKSKGITIGIFMLTIAILTPIALGTIKTRDMTLTFKSLPGILALIVGIVASIFSTKGIYFQKLNPEIVVAISMGTIIGIAFFKGTSSGPIIASGVTYLILSLIGKVGK